MEGFGLVAFEGKVGGETVGHFCVGFGGGESFVDDEAGRFGALAELDVAEGDGGVDDAEGALIADNVFESVDGAGEVSGAHLLVAEGDAEEGLFGLEGEAFFDLVGG